MEAKIEKALDTIRPFLIGDGGNVTLVKYEDGIVYLKFDGHCATCPMRQATLNAMIKDTLVNEIDEVIDVKLV